MDEPIFKSNLTSEEVDRNFADMDFFSELMNALNEVVLQTKGEMPQKHID